MIGYKMLRRKKDGKLYPMYVTNKPTEIGVWLNAEEGERKDGKVKSRLGLLHFRPGWHCSSLPYETHIGKKDSEGKIVALPKDVVWCEVEISDAVNYDAEAHHNGIHSNGKFVARDADLDHVPVNGYYHYKTNPSMYGEWIIAGAIKITKLLTDEELKEICARHNLVPLPREA